VALINLYPVFNTFVSTRRRETDYSGKKYLYVGGRKGWRYRTILRFNLGLIPDGASITSATLQFYLYGNYYPGFTKTFEIHRITSPYCDGNLTWDTQPSFDPEIVNQFNVNSQVNTTISLDLSTLAREWKLGGYQNLGILIKAQNEWQSNRIGLRSLNFEDEAMRPVLQIQYQTAGPGANVTVDGYVFTSTSDNVTTTDGYNFTPGQDVSSLKLYNYFISNTGVNPSTIILQISPDNVTWHTDIPETEVNGANTAVLTVSHLTRYIRMGYRSTDPGNSTTLTYWFQNQS